MKYKLTSNTKEIAGKTLYQIEALKDFGYISKGDLGGWIENEDNLSQKGNCWVFGDARVSGNARVYGNAWVYGNAQVYGDARVFGDAEVYGDARVSGNAEVYGNARVYGNAWVYGESVIFTGNINALSDIIMMPVNYPNTTLTKSGVACGCFKGSPQEFEQAVIEKYGVNYGIYADVIGVLKLKGWL